MPVPDFERNRAYQLLLESILSGRFPSDAPLSERKLSDIFGIGRTPVREALRDLVRDGLLEVKPARGTFVRRLSVLDLREIYQVRQPLEGLAAALAAKCGPTAELSATRDVFEKMAAEPEAFDPGYVYGFGAEFHNEVFRAAQNRVLVETYKPLRLRCRAALALPQYYDHQRVWRSVAEHLKILDAIEAGDADTAHDEICAHLSRGLEARIRIFRKFEGDAAVDTEQMVNDVVSGSD
jgi:DNA-binding GntR family transcriptional regulator